MFLLGGEKKQKYCEAEEAKKEVLPQKNGIFGVMEGLSMSEIYQPPFHMTEEITNLIVEIGQYVGSIVTYEALHQNPVLRRENRIKSIYSSPYRDAGAICSRFDIAADDLAERIQISSAGKKLYLSL